MIGQLPLALRNFRVGRERRQVGCRGNQDDREEGGRENLASQGFELISLLRRSDFPGIDD